jgi:VWFA-related protein
MRLKISFPLMTVVAVSLTSILATSFAQTPQKKRPKLKDFGSSLKRLKWDPTKNETVETRRPNETNTSSDEDDVVRIETNLVTSDILVVDQKGNIVSGLTANDFVITEDGEPQEVGHFHLGDNISIPRTIVLIIDYSGSQFPYLRNSVDAAKLMVDKLTPRDRMAIVTDDVELLVDFTDDKVKLKEKLESLVDRVKDKSIFGFGSPRKFGKSAQYSALMATLNEAFLEEDLRPIVVFQTDGDEVFHMMNPVVTSALPPDLPEDLRQELKPLEEQRLQKQLLQPKLQFSLADVYRAVDRSRATIYTVVPGFRLIGHSPEKQIEKIRSNIDQRNAEFLAKANEKQKNDLLSYQERWRVRSPLNLAFQAKLIVTIQTALAAVAPRTGGWTEFLEKPEQAEGIYKRIFADINQRYIIGYYPTNKEHDGKRRKIRFEVRDRPDYQILGRDYYYAPGVR